MSNLVFIGNREYFPGIGRIAFEGPQSDNPLAFKVYDATRKVGGKTMAEHLRFAVCYWHTFCGDGARSLRPGYAHASLEGTSRPMDAAATSWMPPSSSSPSSACRTTASTTSTWRRRATDIVQVREAISAHGRTGQRAPAGHRHEAAVGHCQPVLAPALHEWRRHQSRLRRGRPRGGAGQGSARCHRGTGRRELRVLGRPRRLCHAATTPT